MYIDISIHAIAIIGITIMATATIKGILDYKEKK